MEKLTLSQKVEYLEVDILKLKKENTALRKALRENSKHARRVEKAYDDALLLISWHVAGIIPSRRYARLYNITQHRYENAYGLLKLARVIHRRRTWAREDLATMERKLAKA